MALKKTQSIWMLQHKMVQVTPARKDSNLACRKVALVRTLSPSSRKKKMQISFNLYQALLVSHPRTRQQIACNSARAICQRSSLSFLASLPVTTMRTLFRKRLSRMINSISTRKFLTQSAPSRWPTTSNLCSTIRP